MVLNRSCRSVDLRIVAMVTAILTICLGACLIGAEFSTRYYEYGMEKYDSIWKPLHQQYLYAKHYGPRDIGIEVIYGRYRDITVLNLKHFTWIVIAVEITAIVSGICLLYGSMKNNKKAVCFHLLLSAISNVMTYICASIAMADAPAVVKLTRDSDPIYLQEVRLMYATGGVLLGAALLSTCFWICAFMFCKTLEPVVIAPTKPDNEVSMNYAL